MLLGATDFGRTLSAVLLLAATGVLLGPAVRAADDPVVEKEKGAQPAVVVPSKAESPVDSEDWRQDPFRHVETDMMRVMSDLCELNVREPVETLQPRIVSRLEELLEQLQKSCSSGGSSGSGAAASPSPTRPANRSTLQGGPGGQGELRDPNTSRRKWADLPPKQREKILQSRTEGFPPGYEDLLEAYFRALAEEKTVESPDPNDETE